MSRVYLQIIFSSILVAEWRPTFWEGAAHSVDRLLFILCLFVILVVSRLVLRAGFEVL